MRICHCLLVGRGLFSELGGSMVSFIAKRVFWGVVVLVLVAIITFVLSRVVPADPAAFLAGQNATEEAVARIRAEQG